MYFFYRTFFNFRGLRPRTPNLSNTVWIIYFHFYNIWILSKNFIFQTLFQSKSISTGPMGRTGRADAFSSTGRAVPGRKNRSVRTSIGKLSSTVNYLSLHTLWRRSIKFLGDKFFPALIIAIYSFTFIDWFMSNYFIILYIKRAIVW